MNETVGRSLRRGLIGVWPAMSVLVMALGLTVMIGWHAHVPALVQLHPGFAPMQYNSALGFLFAGAALLMVNLNMRRLAIPLACFVMLVSLLTLTQYAFATSFGIDQLFFRPYIFTQTSHPGRMSPVTALVFSISGLALLVAAVSSRRPGGPLLIGLLSSLVLALSSMAILGYITGLTGAYGWGELTQMALHTASGFLALGLGLFASAWRAEFAITNRSPRWLPFSTGLAALSSTLVLWHALTIRERAEMQQTIQANAATVKHEIVGRLDSRIQALGRMATRWEFSGQPEREVWEADAASFIEDYPGFQGIAWVDPLLRVRWIVPLAGNAGALGRDLAFEERRRLALEMAREARQARFTRPVQLMVGGAGILASVPIYRQERFEGFIVGSIRLREWLDATLGNDLAPGYAITLAEGGTNIYERPGGLMPPQPEWVAENPIAIHGVDWIARVWPNAEWLAARRSHYTRAVLILGALASALLVLSVYLAQGAIARSQQAVKTNRELQREIVERRRAEQEVQKLGDLQRAIVSHAAYAVISTTPAGIITSFNPAAERMLGYGAGEVVDKNTPALLHDPVEISGRANAFSEELGEKMEPGFEVFAAKARRNLPNQHEWTYVRKDGSRFPVRLGVTCLRDQAGHVTGFLGIAEDISELKCAEAALKKSYQDLVETSRQAGMAEVAADVLHNVGNVLNSVNISASLVASAIRESKVASLSRVVELLRRNETNLAGFFSVDPKGKLLPGYLAQLSGHLAGEQAAALKEIAGLQKNIEHIKDIVAMQRSYARVSGVMETLQISDLVDDALRVNDGALMNHEAQVVREYAQVRPATVNKHKALQVLVNLIRNAFCACEESGRPDPRITLRVADADNQIRISITDNGVGIPLENLTRIFNHGFTTRQGGRGFDLHSGALAATEMGGSLNARSDGPGRGSTFTLDLPYEPPNRESSAAGRSSMKAFLPPDEVQRSMAAGEMGGSLTGHGPSRSSAITLELPCSAREESNV